MAVLLLIHSSYRYGFEIRTKQSKTGSRSLVTYTHDGNTTTIWYNDTYSVTYDSSSYSLDDDTYNAYESGNAVYYDDAQADEDDQVAAADNQTDDVFSENNIIYYIEESEDWDDGSFFGKIIQIGLQIEDSFQTVVQTSPRRWTGSEWALIGISLGILATLVTLLACCCHCSARRCSNVCEKSPDDYTIASNGSLMDDDNTKEDPPTDRTSTKKDDSGMSYVRMAPTGMGTMDRV